MSEGSSLGDHEGNAHVSRIEFRIFIWQEKELLRIVLSTSITSIVCFSGPRSLQPEHLPRRRAATRYLMLDRRRVRVPTVRRVQMHKHRRALRESIGAQRAAVRLLSAVDHGVPLQLREWVRSAMHAS